MVKKVITNLDSSKAYGPDCISVVVLKNCEPPQAFTNCTHGYNHARNMHANGVIRSQKFARY